MGRSMKNNKLSRGVIKEIVKECLIEILAEGLSNPNRSTARKKSRTLKESIVQAGEKSTKSSKRRSSTPSYLDSISFGDKSENNSGDRVKNKKLNEIASNVTSDPILSEMLMDTAHTTLQEQIAAEGNKSFTGSGRGDEAQRIVESSQPEELFGKASSKWASLAFDN